MKHRNTAPLRLSKAVGLTRDEVTQLLWSRLRHLNNTELDRRLSSLNLSVHELSYINQLRSKVYIRS